MYDLKAFMVDKYNKILSGYEAHHVIKGEETIISRTISILLLTKLISVP
jgi:hypothetical protein